MTSTRATLAVPAAYSSVTSLLWPDGTVRLEWIAQGYKEEVGDKVLRAAVDDGPDKVRLRGTSSTRSIEGRVVLTKAQIALLRTFYNTNAASWFAVHDPIDETKILIARFAAPPQMTLLGTTADYCFAALKFEVLN